MKVASGTRSSGASARLHQMFHWPRFLCKGRAVLGPSGSGTVSKTVINAGSNPAHRTKHPFLFPGEVP